MESAASGRKPPSSGADSEFLILLSPWRIAAMGTLPIASGQFFARIGIIMQPDLAAVVTEKGQPRPHTASQNLDAELVKFPLGATSRSNSRSFHGTFSH